MWPYEHTNGDVLRRNDELCRRVAQVFEYIVVGLYDYESESELRGEKRFWRRRLQGTRVLFSEVERVYPLSVDQHVHTMLGEGKSYPNGACLRPLERLVIQYDGSVALCCYDMKGEFDLGSVFDNTIEDVWFSERHFQIVRDLKNGLRTKYPLCSRCALPPTGSSWLESKLKNRLGSLSVVRKNIVPWTRFGRSLGEKRRTCRTTMAKIAKGVRKAKV